jgi:hypothetical protein
VLWKDAVEPERHDDAVAEAAEPVRHDAVAEAAEPGLHDDAAQVAAEQGLHDDTAQVAAEPELHDVRAPDDDSGDHGDCHRICCICRYDTSLHHRGLCSLWAHLDAAEPSRNQE